MTGSNPARAQLPPHFGRNPSDCLTPVGGGALQFNSWQHKESVSDSDYSSILCALVSAECECRREGKGLGLGGSSSVEDYDTPSDADRPLTSHLPLTTTPTPPTHLLIQKTTFISPLPSSPPSSAARSARLCAPLSAGLRLLSTGSMLKDL